MRRRRFLQLSAALACAPLVSAGAAPAVAVIGGGAGGLAAAILIRRRLPAARITLIEQRRHYHSAPYINFALTGVWPAARLRHSYDAAVRAHDIKFVHAACARLRRRRAVLADGAEIAFDYAVAAPGIAFDYAAVEGARDAAEAGMLHAYRGGAQTEQLLGQLRAMPENGVFILIPPPPPYSCPPAPYDRAGMAAHYMERHKPRAKILILDQKEQFAQQTLFTEAWARHYRGRIEWLSAEGGGAVERIDAARRIVHTEFGEERGDVINYIPPQRAAAPAQNSGLSDASGWCPVKAQTMESALRRRIYIIGDAAAVAPAPKSASCAMSQAAVAAAAIARETGAAAPPPDSLDSLCFSHISPALAFSERGHYGLSSAGIRLRSSALTARAAPLAELQQTAADGINWYEQRLAAMFSGSWPADKEQ